MIVNASNKSNSSIEENNFYGEAWVEDEKQLDIVAETIQRKDLSG